MATFLRVLIIEDSEGGVEFLIRLLSEGGYELHYERVNSAPALTACLEAKPWDVVISDSSMSAFSGTEALSIIRGKGLDVPFLFFSGTMSEQAAIEATRMGAQDFILKEHPVRLLAAVQRELHQASIRRREQQMEDRVRRIEKLGALGKLAGGIAHDFNNAISAIMGWAELGAREVEPASGAAESFEQIRQQAERAAGLTRQLLRYARREMFEPCEVNLNQLAGETISLLRRLIGDRIAITLEFDPELGTTRADPSQIEQVVMNLCLNARDAMPEGGSLRIETRNVLLEKKLCSQHPDARPGVYVLLSVSDSGVGMDAKTIERIFEPFFTTKEIGQGTGLGLTTALGVVTRYQGWIEVSSRPGKGSKFDVFLRASGATGANPEPPAPSATETVLVAEEQTQAAVERA